MKLIKNYIRKRTNLSKILDNVGWLALDKFIRLGVGIFVGAWTARYLGPSQYGYLQAILAVISMVGVLADAGVNSILGRDIINRPEERGELMGASFLIKILFSGIGVILVVSIYFFIDSSDLLAIKMAFLASLSYLFLAFNNIDTVFLSEFKSKYGVISRGAGYLVASGIRAYLILYQASVVWFSFLISVEAFLGSLLIILFYYLKGYTIAEWKIKAEKVKSMFKQSFGLILSGIMVIINMQMDKVMIKYMLGEYESGIYSSAVMLSQLLYMMPIIIGSAITPYLVKLRATELPQIYNKRVLKVFETMNLIALVSSLGASLLSGWAIRLLFGAPYEAAAPILVIHTWTSFFVFHVSIRTKILIIEGLQNYIALFSLVIAISNIILNIFMIPHFNIAGAAYASLISWVIGVLIVPLFSFKTKDYPVTFLRSLFPSELLKLR